MDYLGNSVFQHSEDQWLRLQMPVDGSPVRTATWFCDDGGAERMEKK